MIEDQYNKIYKALLPSFSGISNSKSVGFNNRNKNKVVFHRSRKKQTFYAPDLFTVLQMLNGIFDKYNHHNNHDKYLCWYSKK
jgi:hypothetical protein